MKPHLPLFLTFLHAGAQVGCTTESNKNSSNALPEESTTESGVGVWTRFRRQEAQSGPIHPAAAAENYMWELTQT